MTTVELEVLAADLLAFLDKVAAGETILVAAHSRPLAELRPPARTNDVTPDAQELARRREAVENIRAFRGEMARKYGVQPSSVEMIREVRDNPRT